MTCGPKVDLIPADGIDDVLQPSGTPAGSFLDASLVPTYGSIVSTGGLSVHIAPTGPDSAGVVIKVGPGDSGHVELSICSFTVLLDPDTTTTGICGSVTLEVTKGTARVVLGGGTSVVTIPVGGAAKVTDTGGGSFSVENVGDIAVSLTVDGTPTVIRPHETESVETWDFVGFAQPIDNIPTLNRVKAGQVIPIKWRLLDGAGAPITDLSGARITVTSLECPVGTTVDRVEEEVAGSSGLQNLGKGYYQLNWKSPKAYAISCKTLHREIEGVTRDALFQFTK